MDYDPVTLKNLPKYRHELATPLATPKAITPKPDAKPKADTPSAQSIQDLAKHWAAPFRHANRKGRTTRHA